MVVTDMDALRAGVGRAVVTPGDGFPRPHWGGQVLPSEGAVRPLLCSATVFRLGGVALALASLDLCAIRASLVEEVRSRLESVLREPFHLVVNCSHSHEAPFLAEAVSDPLVSAYEKLLVEAVAKAVLQAWEGAVEARVSFASEPVEGLNRNRRKPRASIDRNLSLLRVDGASGEPIAGLWHFAAHPLTNLGLERAWSPDFPGVVAETLERDFGGCQFQYLQGALGDVFPLDWHFRQKHPAHPTGGGTELLMGKRLASELTNLSQRCRPIEVRRLGWAEERIQLRSRSIPWSLDEIDNRLVPLETQLDEAKFQAWSPEDHVVNVAQRHETRYQVLGLRMLRRMKLEEETVRSCPLSTLALGPLAMAVIPGEPFSREGLIVRRSAPPLPCLTLGCSNGYLSYIPSEREALEVLDWDLDQLIDQKKNRWAYGATITTYLAPDSSSRILTTLLRLLAELQDHQKRQ